MPIYEYYCPDCHVIFNFFSRSIRTDRRPKCPRCRRPDLEKQVSRFSATGRAAEKPGPETADSDPAMDARMEKAFESMAADADAMDDDPRSAAQFMRKLSGAAGIKLNGAMEKTLQRIEAGEDPDSIEADMGDALSEANPFGAPEDGRGRVRNNAAPPERDETLHEFD